jgi:NADH pyrophosphatase NudC (nudix superfamily)
VEVGEIKYAGVSQSWPFPLMSLMCGFYATTEGMPEVSLRCLFSITFLIRCFLQPRIDKRELEDAQWFTRSEVITAFENASKYQNDPGSFEANPSHRISLIPWSGAVAHDLIKSWIAGKC